MEFSRTIFLFVAFVSCVFAYPADVFLGDLGLQNPNLFGGDMLNVEANDRAVIPTDEKRWPAAVIPYVIDSGLQAYRGMIQQAMAHYQQLTCIRFKERTSEYNYVRIFPGQGCYSEVGMSGKPAQLLSLGGGCLNHGIIVHELGHSVGFFHEHMRSDRDNFINIFWNNIGNGLDNQFTKMSSFQHRLFDTFDFNSIMLYGELSFSKDNVSPTMAPKSGGFRMREVHEKTGLSTSDVSRIKKLYKC